MDFNEYAKHWDNDKRILRAARIASEIRTALHTDGTGEALEFGCGTGLISFHFLDDFAGITLLDPSEGMISILSDKVANAQITTMTPVQGTISEHAAEWEGKFKVIYTSMALHHIVEIKETLSLLTECLAPNGQFVIIDLEKEDGHFHADEKHFEGHHGFDHTVLQGILGDVGLTSVRSHVFFEGFKETANGQVAYTLFIMCARKV